MLRSLVYFSFKNYSNHLIRFHQSSTTTAFVSSTISKSLLILASRSNPSLPFINSLSYNTNRFSHIRSFHSTRICMDNESRDRESSTSSSISMDEGGGSDDRSSISTDLSSAGRASVNTVILPIQPSKLPSLLSDWTARHVLIWLSRIGFTDYQAEVERLNWDGATLKLLNEQKLIDEVGMKSGWMRKNFLDEIHTLRINHDPEYAAIISAQSGEGTTVSKQLTQAEEIALLETMLPSVLKIFCTSTTPNYSIPWQRRRQHSSTSSGFVVSGQRIIGNAHGVTNQSSIRVRRHGDPKKYPATIIAISHEADLVILSVADSRFWLGLEALEFGNVPKLHESVSVIGYPTGGDAVSVTKGVVSRVTVSTYSHSGESLLSVQIDAAINSGNSGGPAMLGDKVVGVAFETLTSAQNIGYIIPVPVIKHFLDDIALHGKYTGFPRLGFSWQKLENDSLKKYYHVSGKRQGILINSIEGLDACEGILEKNDVLLAIDDVPVAEDGTIFYRRGERVSFRYLEGSRFVGESMTMDVIRNGEKKILTVKLEGRKSLVPLHLHDKLPSYFVFGGLVFTILSRAYLYHEYSKDWPRKGPVDLIKHAYYGELEKPDHEIVLLSHLLVDDINSGYQSSHFANMCVKKVNGIEIRNLKQLVMIVEDHCKKLIEAETIEAAEEKKRKTRK